MIISNSLRKPIMAVIAENYTELDTSNMTALNEIITKGIYRKFDEYCAIRRLVYNNVYNCSECPLSYFCNGKSAMSVYEIDDILK